MLVIDASVVVELLLGTATGRGVAPRIAADRLVAPELLDLEVLSAQQRHVAAGRLSERRAGEAVDDLAAAPIRRYRHRVLVGRVWALRATVSPYDALYVALAEALAAPLLTCDARLARAHGHDAHVVLAPPPR
jgi:predicted nucleic acid-binding protein